MEGDVKQPEKPYHCTECRGGFSQRKNLERHTRTRHATGEEVRSKCPYEWCEFARKGFSRKDKLDLHIRRLHSISSIHPNPTRSVTDTRASQDPANDRTLSSSFSNLTHCKQQQTPFICRYPGCSRLKGFKTSSDLRRHERAIHARQNNGYFCPSERCPTPDKIWSRLDNLRQHIHNVHKQERPEDLIQQSKLAKSELPMDNNIQATSSFIFSPYQLKVNGKKN